MDFPDNFRFGWSQSGFQFEMGGGSAIDPNSDWYKWVHDKENLIAGVVSGDLPEMGVGYLKEYRYFHREGAKMGLNTIRLGTEWSRLFPTPGEVNQAAVSQYREILKDLKGMGYHVILNLYHWSMPLWIHDPVKVRKGDLSKGGWLNGDTVQRFQEYVEEAVRDFDDLVDEYVIVNEPNVIWKAGYIMVKMGFPPSYLDLEKAELVKRNLISACNLAYKSIKSMSRKKVGVVYAMADIQGEREVREKAVEEEEFSFLDHISWDWLGVNYYTRIVVTQEEGFFTVRKGVGMYAQGYQRSLEGREVSDNGWEVYPEGIRNVLNEVWRRYGKELYVTENGVADSQDRIRPRYIISHLYFIKKAMEEGVRVNGYLHWSLVDNYEWSSGFNARFGLMGMDFKERKTWWRPSAYVYREIATTRELGERMLNSLGFEV